MTTAHHEELNEFETLYEEAHRAGLAAVHKMVTARFASDPRSAELDPFTKNYIPGEGCGFAWISINGNSAFGRWAKKYKGWERLYPRGFGTSVSEFGQSENRKAAYAWAFANHLTAAGILAHADSRSD
jgi:hypothetical protein